MHMWFHARLAQKILNGIYYVVPTYNFEDLSMSVVYDNNVLNPIRGQQAGASYRRLCCLDSAGSLPPTGHIF